MNESNDGFKQDAVIMKREFSSSKLLLVNYILIYRLECSKTRRHCLNWQLLFQYHYCHETIWV